MDAKNRVKEAVKRLKKQYPGEIIFLHYSSPFQLMIAVILSARTTDRQVNIVTPVLFEKYPDPLSLMNADPEEVENIIRSTGFYRAKAANIIAAAEKLVTDFNSDVPEAMDELLEIPGVGRKSANVIRSHCFGKPAVIVDTHFARVSVRLGLASKGDPVRIEKAVSEVAAPEIQSDLSMLLNIHGREVCKARQPLCGECVLNDICPGSIILR